MTTHDQFIGDMWWLLQAIKKETLSTPNEIEFSVRTGNDGSPSAATQCNMLRRLRGWYLLDFEGQATLDDLDKPMNLHLSIDTKKFNDIYILFENGLKLNIAGSELYDLANRWVRPLSYSDKKSFEAWEIIRGKVKPTKYFRTKNGLPTKPIVILPEGANWEDIEIRFKNLFDIDISFREKPVKSTNHQELMFYKSKTREKDPDRQWKLLHLLASIYTLSAQQKLTLPPATIKDLVPGFSKNAGALQTIKKKLSQHLQVIFGIKNDPFEEYKNVCYYRTKFKLVTTDLPNEKLHEFGQSLDDTQTYGDHNGEQEDPEDTIG